MDMDMDMDMEAPLFALQFAPLLRTLRSNAPLKKEQKISWICQYAARLRYVRHGIVDENIPLRDLGSWWDVGVESGAKTGLKTVWRLTDICLSNTPK